MALRVTAKSPDRLPAVTGLRPIVDIYSTFLQRAFDHIFQEVALQNLPVTFMLDRAGLAGPDGRVSNNRYHFYATAAEAISRKMTSPTIGSRKIEAITKSGSNRFQGAHAFDVHRGAHADVRGPADVVDVRHQRDLAALAQHDHRVADPHDEPHVVLHDHQRDAGAADAAQGLAEVEARELPQRLARARHVQRAGVDSGVGDGGNSGGGDAGIDTPKDQGGGC